MDWDARTQDVAAMMMRVPLEKQRRQREATEALFQMTTFFEGCGGSIESVVDWLKEIDVSTLSEEGLAAYEESVAALDAAMRGTTFREMEPMSFLKSALQTLRKHA